MTKKNVRLHTPLGRAVYPRLGRPDVKYYDLGLYRADVMVKLDDVKELLAKLSGIYERHTGSPPNKTDNYMWKIELDEDGRLASEVLLKLRIKNRIGKDGNLWDRKPKLFDASLTPCPAVIPYGGTEMVVNFEVYEWEAGNKKGVSLQPVAVQILKLVQGDDSAEGYGFAAASGFEAPEDNQTEDTIDVDQEDQPDF